MVSLRGVWSVGALLLTVGSFAGGDTSEVAGWLYLIWTAPFGPLWWFYVYPWVKPLFAGPVAQGLGTVVAAIAAYAFWFMLVPRLSAFSQRMRSTGSNAP